MSNIVVTTSPLTIKSPSHTPITVIVHQHSKPITLSCIKYVTLITNALDIVPTELEVQIEMFVLLNYFVSN